MCINLTCKFNVISYANLTVLENRYAVLRNTLNCWICVWQLARYSTGDERESKFTVTVGITIPAH